MKKLGDYSKIPVLGTRGKILLFAGLVVLGLLVLVLALANWPKPAAPMPKAEKVEPGLAIQWLWVAAILIVAFAVGILYIRGRLMADFIARSWKGWLVLALAGIWRVTGGGQLLSWKYFQQMAAVLSLGTIAGAFYTIWMLRRAGDEYAYEEAGAGSFTIFALLLSLWVALVGSPVGT